MQRKCTVCMVESGHVLSHANVTCGGIELPVVV